MSALKSLDPLGVVINDAGYHAVLVRRDLAHPAMRAQFDAGALRGGPIRNVRARLCSLRAAWGAMTEIDAARPPLVIHGGDSGIGGPPVPSQPVHRFPQYRARAPDRQRGHWRISRRNTGIAGQTGDPHHPVILLEERDQRLVLDRPVLRHAVEAPYTEIGWMQAREMRRVHDRAAANAIEVDDFDRRVVVVDRVILGPGTDIGARGEVAEEARLPVPASAGVRRRVHPAALFEAEDVHLCFGETPGYGCTGCACADNEHVDGIIHAGLFLRPSNIAALDCRASGRAEASEIPASQEAPLNRYPKADPFSARLHSVF